MYQGNMVKSLLLLSASLAVSGCYAGPHLDLSKPLCFITDNPSAGRASVFGTRVWARHIPGFPVPRVNDPKCENAPIYVVEDKTMCALGKARIGRNSYRIFLREAEGGSWAMSHELGHTFGIHKHVKGRLSLMTFDADAGDVMPLDLELVCKLHPELKCPTFKWCQGTFYNPLFCPSSSPEEGFKKWRQKNEESLHRMESKSRVRLLQRSSTGYWCPSTNSSLPNQRKRCCSGTFW